jgi:hypothetical protein
MGSFYDPAVLTHTTTPHPLAGALAAGLGITLSRAEVRSVVEIKDKHRHKGVVDDALNGAELLRLLAGKGVTPAHVRALFRAAYVAPEAHLRDALRSVRDPASRANAVLLPAVAAPVFPAALLAAESASLIDDDEEEEEEDDDDDEMSWERCPGTPRVAAAEHEYKGGDEATSVLRAAAAADAEAQRSAAVAAMAPAAADTGYEAMLQSILLIGLGLDRALDADSARAFWDAVPPRVELLWRVDLAAGEAVPLSITHALLAHDPRAAAFTAAYAAAAGAPVWLRGFRVVLPCGTELLSACGELRGGAFTLAYVDSRPLPEAYGAPRGATGALAAAAIAAALAAAAALDGATRASLASSAPGWYRAGRWLVREGYMLFGRTDTRARHELPPGTSNAEADAIAARLQAEANARLQEVVYPRAFALAEQLGVALSWRRLQAHVPGDGDAMPVFPGCHFTKKGFSLLVGAEPLLPTDASLGAATLRLLDDAGNAAMVATLAQPHAVHMARARLLAVTLAGAARDATAAARVAGRAAPPRAAHLASHFASQLLAALAKAKAPAAAVEAAVANKSMTRAEALGALRCGGNLTATLLGEYEALQAREQKARGRGAQVAAA